MNLNLSSVQWKTIRAAIAAGLTFLLVTQNDVTLPPLVKVAAGMVLVILAVLESPEQTTGDAGSDDPPPAE